MVKNNILYAQGVQGNNLLQRQGKAFKIKSTVSKIGGYIYLFAVLSVIYIPIVMIIVYSFSNGQGMSNFEFSLNNIKGLADTSDYENKRMLTALANTFIVGLISSASATVLGTFGALGINAMNKKLRNSFLNASNIPIFNADIIIALSLMLLFINLGVRKGELTVILSHIAITTPYVALNVLPRLKQMNPSIYEAALDLGSTPFFATLKVVIPEILPGMLSGFVLAFTLSIDDFVVADYTRSNNFETLSTYIYAKAAGKAGLSGTLKPLSALIFLTVLIVLIAWNIYSNKKKSKN